MWYLLEAKWESKPVTDAPVRKLHDMLSQRPPGAVGILASRSGFSDSALRRAQSARDVILLDRPDIEALISGAVPAPELIATASRSLAVFGEPKSSMATRLRPRRPTAMPLALGAPDDFSPAAVAAPDGLDADIIAHSSEILGLGTRAGRPLVTVASGLIEIDQKKTQLRYRVEITGCSGAAYVEKDGALLIARAGGVVRVRDDGVEVAAGGYSRPPLVVSGVEGTPWLLDRDTSGWPTNQDAILVELGARLGDERRFPARLPAAACNSACWLRDRVFFILGNGGYNAVVDLDSDTFRWLVPTVARPHGMVRLDEQRVLIIGADQYVQAMVLNVDSEQATPPVAINLRGPAGDAVRLGDSVFFVAGAPVDSATVLPVIARVDLDLHPLR